MRILGLATALVVWWAHFSSASPVDIYRSVADGTVWFNGLVQYDYVAAAGSYSGTGYEGDIQFARFDSSRYSSIQLELNPYALPLFDLNPEIWGYDNAPGYLSGADYNAGMFLGNLHLPPDLDYYEQVYFDVTSFVHSAQGDYFGFEIRANGDFFTSSHYSYFLTPPELFATIPEPSCLAVVMLAVAVAVVGKRGRADSRKPEPGRLVRSNGSAG
jgi:hypothetical protein